MHYCCLVFTDEFPVDSVIEEKLKPFYEDDYYNSYDEGTDTYSLPRPAFTWDWWQVAGRYCGRIKMKIDRNLQEYNWGVYANNPRVGRLFRNELIKKGREDSKALGNFWRFHEEDYFPYMQPDDDSLWVDAAEVRLIENKDNLFGYCMVKTNGEGVSCETWDGDGFITNKDYEDSVREEFKRAKYLCIVDIHD